MSDPKYVLSVERFIPASPARIFDLLADPVRHVELDGSGTVKEAQGPSQRLGLGSEFGMSMRGGVGYSMTNRVVEFEENRRITWAPRPANRLLTAVAGGRRWSYELTPVEGGTLVRETWDLRREPGRAVLWPYLRRKTRVAMERTLERLEAMVV